MRNVMTLHDKRVRKTVALAEPKRCKRLSDRMAVGIMVITEMTQKECGAFGQRFARRLAARSIISRTWCRYILCTSLTIFTSFNLRAKDGMDASESQSLSGS